MPTFHFTALHARNLNLIPDDIHVDPVETLTTDVQTATYLHFKVANAYNIDDLAFDFDDFEAMCNAPGDDTVTITPMAADFKLLQNVAYGPAAPLVRVPANNQFELFDESTDVAPLLYVLEPIEDDTVSAWKASAFGMIIESFEIDGCAVPCPNPENALSLENARFMESALSSSMLVHATAFNNVSTHTVRKRHVETRNNFRVLSILYDYSKIVIPRVLQRTIGNLIANGFAGFNFLNNVTWIAATAQFFGFRLASPSSDPDATRDPPHIAQNTLYLWTPYTYSPSEIDLVDDDHGNPCVRDRHPIYHLANLRSIFGTDPQLIEMQHYFEAMPSP
jgi:hypothetical protein